MRLAEGLEMNSAWSNGGTYVIAEVGLNHNGDLQRALDLINIAVDAGVDAVKLQKRDVASLAIAAELDKQDLRFPKLGTTYREIREKHEFSLEEFQVLKGRADENGLDFFVTPFDIPSLEFLEVLGCERYKIASHSVTNLPLLNEIARTGKPALMSTGMATLAEVDHAVSTLQSGDLDLAIMHCVSSYPTRAEELRLDLIDFYRQRFGLPTGYSGHEIGYLPTIVAVCEGASIVERHITTDHSLEGFDHRLSLDPPQLMEMMAWIRSLPLMFGSGQKDITESELVTRRKYQVSAVSSGTIAKGQALRLENVCFKNPGTGLTPEALGALIGKIARENIPKDVVLLAEMFES